MKNDYLIMRLSPYLEMVIQNITGTEFSLDRKDLTSGIYFYISTDKNGLTVNGKLIVE